MPLPRRLAAATLLAALPTAATGARAAAAAPAGGTESVTVVLAPAHASALHALAARSGASPDRAAQARASRPSDTDHRTAVDALTALGLRVSAGSPWTVTATGPASVIARAFGSARSVRPGIDVGQPLPHLPTALQGIAVTALGGDETRPAARPLGSVSYNGGDLRTAYDQAATPPDTDLTVATLQLSGFRAADLTHYAEHYGLPDPVASGQFHAVSVDGGDPTDTSSTGGAAEVTLDTESILGIAHGARQRAYVAPNSLAGFIDALYAIGDDASSGSTDRHLAALSISWGACEAYWGTSSLKAMENALAYVSAAGVSIFAASGDDGVTDCGAGGGRSVDFPASSPLVVGVGGTRLETAAGTETAWRGSGGGPSAVFGRPSWQTGHGIAAGPHRLVPDIASDANPDTGFRTYVSGLGGWTVIGGTSLAAPTSAAMLTNELAAGGYSAGVGDLHAALYAAPSAGFRDITAGTNTSAHVTGYAATAGYDRVTGLGRPKWDTIAPALLAARLTVPTWSPASVPVTVAAPAGTLYGTAGIDAVPSNCPAPATQEQPPADYGTTTAGSHTVWLTLDTGSGCRVLHAATRVDTAAPATTSWVGLPNHTRPTIGASWSASDADSGVDSYHVTLVRRIGHTDTVLNAPRTLATSLHGLPAEEGWTYYLTVVGRDRAGNTATATSRTAVPLDDRNGTTLHGRWARSTDSTAFDGTLSTSDSDGATLSRQLQGSSYRLWFATGPNKGLAQIYLDGHLTGTVDLYSAVRTAQHSVTVGSFSSVGRHTVTVKVAGRHRAASGDDAVTVDAIIAVS